MSDVLIELDLHPFGDDRRVRIEEFAVERFVPIAIMPAWSRTLARANPVSVVVDASRHAMVGDLWSNQLIAALAVLTTWVGLSQVAAWRMLHSKLAKG